MKIVNDSWSKTAICEDRRCLTGVRSSTQVQEILVHTDQHYGDNMSKIFFDELEIPRPIYNLGIGSGSHGEQTGRMLAAIAAVLMKEGPEWVLVYGDTNSTLAGALAAVKLHLPVAHVEAGLRSFNRRMPEEINRIVTDDVSEMLFSPTSVASKNLLREGVPPEKIHQVGDVMYDAALFYGARVKERGDSIERWEVKPAGYVLATVHRAENTDDPKRLRVICEALSAVAKVWPVILPAHPRTRKTLADAGLKFSDDVKIIDPVGYLGMIALEMNARVIATDSGGVQKEAYFCHVPCVTLRDETEWVELVELGWNDLAPPLSRTTVADSILGAATPSKTADSFPFGNGHSAEFIRDLLLRPERLSPETEVVNKTTKFPWSGEVAN